VKHDVEAPVASDTVQSVDVAGCSDVNTLGHDDASDVSTFGPDEASARTLELHSEQASDAAAETPAKGDPWRRLRDLTSARIALGRAGTSLPTHAQLDFQYAHAQARDAVHLPFDGEALAAKIQQRGRECLSLHSAAPDRHTYLQRPDLGRRLDEASIALLEEHAQANPAGYDLAVVIADGLSALAVERHSLPMLQRIDDLAAAEGWSLAPVTLMSQGRVAVADEVAELLKARMVVILIGERPGLSSPDSLGLYFTYAPRVGLTDAARNCISNVRLEGMSYGMAAHKLLYLLREACVRGLSGVSLKDEALVPTLEHGEEARPGNFLLPGPPGS
jgi:ethanolamine ammonia-lyase small subunit